MDIVIVAQYLRNIENFEGNNSRFVYLAKMLVSDSANKVEIITSDFGHGKKQHFTGVGQLEGIKVTALHESGYPTNVCLKRFASHKELAKNIRAYLDRRKKPDVIYVAVPSLAVADVCASYCKKNGVRFIVDIQDLWPEAFKMVVDIPVISDIGFYPMKKQADRIYSTADQIVAVSQTYADRALKANRRVGKGCAVFLGARLETFDAYVRDNFASQNKDYIYIAYCGTLGSSYDITCVIDALAILQNRYNNLKFLVMGDGPRREEFENYAKLKNIDAEFTGSLPYPQMCGRLAACDIAVNPITHGAAQSIINKHGDYAAAGLPVVSTQESPEYRSLVEEYHMGFNCKNGNAEDVAEKLAILMRDPALRTEMGKNARRCAEERFDRKASYKKIIEVIRQ